MYLKILSIGFCLVTFSSALPTIAVDLNNPQIPIASLVTLPLQPLQNQPVAQPRTFGNLFGSSYSSGFRYPEGHRGYPSYGQAYFGSVYANSPAVTAAIVPQQVPGAYGGYGWRGGSDNRGYGAQSGWAHQPASGWSGNYGR